MRESSNLVRDKEYSVQPVAEFKTKRAVALDLLREAIITQAIAPGSRLILEDLSQQFGLSATPIREALPALEAEGLIAQMPHKGAVVTPMDYEEVLELYSMRAGLEGMVASYAVAELKDADIAGMEAALRRMERYRGDWVQFLEQDKVFHACLYQAAGSQRWLDTIDNLWRRCNRYMLASTVMTGAEAMISSDHQDIIMGCKMRDAEGVSTMIVEHLKHSRDRLLREWS
ncbi:MAG: GntR family transcriptional regulator [Thermomicrobiales bacterium]|nr:GntR family transcriptional regulator [Thermomicrobiales bacterium]